MQNEISKQDIINVAKSINKSVSESQINWILENYNSHKKEDPETIWTLIVENMLYALPLMGKVTKKVKTPSVIKSEILNLCYILEDRLNYDETPQGTQIGQIINQLKKITL
jgi:hypothetical protein